MGFVLARVAIFNSLWEQLTGAGAQEEGEGGALDPPLCQGERDMLLCFWDLSLNSEAPSNASGLQDADMAALQQNMVEVKGTQWFYSFSSFFSFGESSKMVTVIPK